MGDSVEVEKILLRNALWNAVRRLCASGGSVSFYYLVSLSCCFLTQASPRQHIDRTSVWLILLCNACPWSYLSLSLILVTFGPRGPLIIMSARVCTSRNPIGIGSVSSAVARSRVFVVQRPECLWNRELSLSLCLSPSNISVGLLQPKHRGKPLYFFFSLPHYVTLSVTFLSR